MPASATPELPPKRPEDLATRLKRLDPDRMLAALFAPLSARRDLFSLIAFNYEIARVREVVTQPILGQIRLQWWRDAIAGIYTGTAPRHEVVQELAEAVARHGLTRALLDRMIDAREADLAEAPPADLDALLLYAEETAGSLVVLELQALGMEREGAERTGNAVGTAYALTGLIRAVPFHARAGRVMVPAALLEEHGLTPESLLSPEPPQGLPRALAEIGRLARLQLAEARDLGAGLPRRAIPALLSATVAETYLTRLERAGFDLRRPEAVERAPGLAWRLAAKAWTGRW